MEWPFHRKQSPTLAYSLVQFNHLILMSWLFKKLIIFYLVHNLDHR